MLKDDTEFIKNLYQDYGKYIYIFCLSRLKDKDNAMDCMQETFRVALEKLVYSNTKIIKPKAWLTAIASFTIKSFIKKQAVLHKHVIPIDELAADILNINYDEDLIIEKITSENIDMDKVIKDIKSTLSEKEYVLYQKHYIKKDTPSHLAEELNISYSAVTTRINRVKNKIIDIVKKHINN